MTEQFGKDGLPLVPHDILIDVTIHEAVHKCRVSVYVYVEIKIYALLSTKYHHFVTQNTDLARKNTGYNIFSGYELCLNNCN